MLGGVGLEGRVEDRQDHVPALGDERHNVLIVPQEQRALRHLSTRLGIQGLGSGAVTQSTPALTTAQHIHMHRGTGWSRARAVPPVSRAS